MGTFHVTIDVGRDEQGPFEPVEALVDSGATHTLLPSKFLERLGVRRRRTLPFVIADGSVPDLDLGLAWVRLRGEESPAWVIFGPDDAEPLLGVMTLEEFACAIDPYHRELIPLRNYLVGLRGGTGQ